VITVRDKIIAEQTVLRDILSPYMKNVFERLSTVKLVSKKREYIISKSMKN